MARRMSSASNGRPGSGTRSTAADAEEVSMGVAEGIGTKSVQPTDPAATRRRSGPSTRRLLGTMQERHHLLTRHAPRRAVPGPAASAGDAGRGEAVDVRLVDRALVIGEVIA